jgi:sensor histidine kinase YesM
MVVHRLSALLRRRLRDPNHFVTLREEIEAVDEYLDIEQIRFGPQLRVRKEVDERALDVLVPSMILQPLIENCIKHGLSRKVGGGTITLRISRLDGAARVEIRDDGLGMSDERRETAFSDGIGLSNVSERLRVIYGARSTLQLTSVIGQGTAVAFEIPDIAEERASA